MKKNICTIVFWFMCGLHGVICGLMKIELTDWKRWILFLCIAVAYCCGIGVGESMKD